MRVSRWFVLALRHREGVGGRGAAADFRRDAELLRDPVDLRLVEMRDRLEKQGVGPKMIDSYLALASYQKAGGATARVSDSVADILGRPPRTIRDFVRDYRKHFVGSGA